MSIEVFWLVLTVGMTGLFWVPYILDRFSTRGIMETLGYPGADTPPQSEVKKAFKPYEGRVAKPSTAK